MMSFRLIVPVALFLGVAVPAVQAQTEHRVQVVQVAGVNLYLSAGADTGIRGGDTLAVRRPADQGLAGSFVVLSTTSSRSVVSFLGTPFPVTRGDTLVVMIRTGTVIAAAARPAEAAAPALRPVRRTGRSSGAIGFEVSGARNITYGLGADPVKTVQDYATPGMRFRWAVDNPGSGTMLTLNLMATHRAGPATLFDRQTLVRVYEAQVSQAVAGGAARMSVGRFLSTFDRASGYWDGAMVRLGRERGISAGFAAGFEPVRADETFSTDAPKYAGFVSLRASGPAVHYRGEVSFLQMLPRGLSPRRSVLGVTQRLDAGVLHLGQDIEAGPQPGLSSWKVNRFQGRASVDAGRDNELWATVVSDEPPALDTAFTLPLSRRERAGAGISHHGSRFYFDLDGSINAPRTAASRGYAGGVSVGLPGLFRGFSLYTYANYFRFTGSQGVIASPSLEYTLGGIRTRVGYQFLLSKGSLYQVMTHGADVIFTRALSGRVDWMMRFNARYGDNLRSVGVYSSLDIRF